MKLAEIEGTRPVFKCGVYEVLKFLFMSLYIYVFGFLVYL